MKKILFSILALVAVMSASATEKTSAFDLSKMTGWGESESSYSYNSETGVGTISAYAWKGATLYYGSTTPYDATGFEQVELELASACTQKVSMTVYYADGSFNVAYIAAGDTKCDVNLAKYSIDKIDICNFSATNSVTIELKSLKLNGWKGTRNAETISTESKDLGNWSWDDRYLVAADKFTNATAGSKLIFTFTEDTEVEVKEEGESKIQTCTYWQICTMDGKGTVLTGNSADLSDNNMNFSSGQTCYAMELNADDVELLKENGLMVRGYGITLTKVELVYYVETPVDPTIDEIDLTQAMTGWDSNYDPTTKTVTWTKGWGGCGWWFGGKDCSGYSKVVYEFDGEAPYSGGLTVQYATGSESYVGFESGATTVEYTFDPTRSASVNAIYLKLADAGSLKLKRVYFEKATEPTQVKVNMYVRAEMGCATFCAPFEVEIPGEVEAYKATSIEGDAINLEKVEGTIPAYTPVVLTYKGEADFTKNFTSAIATGSETAGILTGNYTDAINVVPVNSYILQCNDNKTGWYQVADENKLKVGPNRCYLTNSVDARAFYGMNFGETTGIQNVAAVVATKADGKYLVNGQFVVVKAGKAYNMNGQVIK